MYQERNVPQSGASTAFILIVDDVQGNVQMLGSILTDAGYRVTAASNGEQALKIVKKRMPDLILLDVMMPGMDGYETCHKLKRIPDTGDIPVIFLTAKNDVDDIIKGFEVGGVDYLSKPVNSVELLVRLKNHLNLKKSRELLEQTGETHKELLHILCHDLNNPFSFIISALDLIKSDPEANTSDNYKNDIYAAAENGMRLIDLVRQLSVTEDKKTVLQLNDLNLLMSVEHSLRMLRPQFDAMNIKPRVSIPSGLIIRAEESSLINTVFNNILTNALKFSFPDSTIEIKAAVIGNRIILSVKDSGIGMSPGLIGNIFDLTKKTARVDTNGETGTGFGMPLVKQFVEMYGGTIEIISIEKNMDTGNHGTEVMLSFVAG